MKRHDVILQKGRTSKPVCSLPVYVGLSLTLICPSNSPASTLHPNINLVIYLNCLFITEYINTFHQELQVGRIKTINSTIESNCFSVAASQIYEIIKGNQATVNPPVTMTVVLVAFHSLRENPFPFVVPWSFLKPAKCL